jgi:hypothetical protein
VCGPCQGTRFCWRNSAGIRSGAGHSQRDIHRRPDRQGSGLDFYYSGPVGSVIEDSNLAGPGGSATNVGRAGDAGNVAYLRAALTQELQHAALFRSLLGIPNAAQDPVQTFYFPAGTFDSLAAFTGLLDALENAFIGAYLNPIQEFAAKSGNAHRGDGA